MKSMLIHYVRFTQKNNIQGLFIDYWGSSGSGISIEIYASKSKAWQDYSIDAWEGGFIDLSEIKNGAACTIKISASEESSTPDGSIG